MFPAEVPMEEMAARGGISSPLHPAVIEHSWI